VSQQNGLSHRPIYSILGLATTPPIDKGSFIGLSDQKIAFTINLLQKAKHGVFYPFPDVEINICDDQQRDSSSSFIFCQPTIGGLLLSSKLHGCSKKSKVDYWICIYLYGY
jgi:hypothetical protein